MAKQKFDPCLQIKVDEKFGITEEVAKELVERLKKEKEALQGDPEYLVKFKRAVGALTKEELQALHYAKVARRRQALVAKRLDQKIVNDPTPNKALNAFLTGDQTYKGKGNLVSVAGEQEAKRSERIGRVLNALGKLAAFDLAKPTFMGKYPFGYGLFDDPNFQRNAVLESFDAPKEKRAVTNDTMAQKFAQALILEKKDIISQMRQLGVNIGWLEDHVTTQYHDSVAILKGGFDNKGFFKGNALTPDEAFEKWALRLYNPNQTDEANTGLLDIQRTFTSSDKTERMKFLRAVFDNITSGNRKVKELIPTDLSIGRMSLANKMAQSRQIHFKDGDAWLSYNAEYGHRNPINAMLTGLERLSDDLELMKGMGPNPQSTFERLLENSNLTPHQRTVAQFRFDQISGKAFEISNPTLHQWESGISGIQTMSKLGSAVFSAFSDPIYTAFTRSYHGVNFFSAYYDALLVPLKYFGTLGGRYSNPEVKEFATLLMLGMEGAVGSSVSRFASARSMNQSISEMTNNFFRWNLLNGWTNYMRQGASYMMARDLVTASKRGWSELNESYRYVLGQYGITEADWSIIKELPKTKVSKIDIITPHGVRTAIEQGLVPPDKATSYARIADRIQAFLIGENKMAVIEPGASERAFMRRFPFGGNETTAGTASSMAGRLFWQFRGFGVAMMMKNYPRIAKMGLPAVYHLFPMVLAGYGIKAAKDILKGKEPVNPKDPSEILKVAVSSVLQSGFGGLAADLVLNDYRKYGSGFADVLGGPTISTMQDLAELGSATANVIVGNEPIGEIGETAWAVLRNNTPYVNFWATRTAFDYLIDYQIREMLNPGSLGRMERRMRRNNNQNYWPGYAPSDIVQYGGGL